MGTFKVSATGGTIITRQGRAVAPGQEVTSEEIGSAEGELVRDGKIFPLGVVNTKIVEKPVSSNGATVANLSLNSEGKLTPKPEIETKVVTAPTPPAAPTAPQRLTGIWTCPVDTLVNKSLEELNAMVMERDNTIPPFDDKNEAIAQLSMDVPPAK